MSCVPDIRLEEAESLFFANLDFEETFSVAKARSFITAAKKLLYLLPLSASDQGSSLTHNIAQIEAMMRRAQQYVDAQTAAADGGGRVRFLSASEGFRR